MKPSYIIFGPFWPIYRNLKPSFGPKRTLNSSFLLRIPSKINFYSIFLGLGGHHSVSSLLAPSSAIKVKGRQLLDQEGLSCLLIVLFIDDPKINSARLHRILRNLCYHSGTREWVIKSLLSILEKSNEHKSSPETGEILQPSAAKIRKSNNGGGSEKTSSGPSWLTISMDAALGFRANVFQVARLPSSGGKKTCSTSANSVISIHPGTIFDDLFECSLAFLTFLNFGFTLCDFNFVNSYPIQKFH